MKKIVFVFSLLFAYSTMSVGRTQPMAPASDPHMTAEERAKIVRLLRESQAEFLAALENLTEAQWTYKPSPFQWSVGLVAEHILITEGALYSAMQKALAEKPNPEWESKTAGKAEFIERVMPNRVGKAQAPTEVRPTGKPTREEVVRRFREVREKTMQFAEKTDLPLKAHTYDHPFRVFNTLSAYDWLLYIPLHNQRHNKQIAEVKASPGYPN